MNKENITYTTIFTGIVAILFVAGLAAVYATTKPLVEQNARIAREKAILGTIGIIASEEDQSKKFEEYFVGQNLDNTYFTTNVDEAPVVINYFEGQGLWSTIKGFIAISEDASKIYGLEFTEQTETPGLGGEIEKPWFRDQFRGLHLPGGAMSYATAAVGKDQEKGVVDSITGATRTSDSILQIVNKEINLVKGGN